MKLPSYRIGAAVWLVLAACGSSTNPDDCPNGICSDGGSDDDGGMSCAESWVCTPWETSGVDDEGTRSCVDVNDCGTTALEPVRQATLPALDVNYYQCNVEPVFDLKCSQLACHGTEQDRALRIYARGRLRIAGETWIEPGCLSQGQPKPSDECVGSIECYCWTLPHSTAEWRKNYDSARGFALQNDGRPIPAGMETTSELLAQPVIGGKPHVGIHVFREGDADYEMIRSWLAGATLGTCNTTN